MRSIFISLFILISSLAPAATYYVATNGSDSNSGSISSPFLTWQKGFSIAQPGDIVYVRGGTYYPKGILGSNVYSGVYINAKNGSSGKMINIWAYPGEKPVLDCKYMTQSASHMGVYLRECSYWYLRGLTIKNAIQTPGFGAHGLYLRSGNYNRFEQIDISYIGGSGLCMLYNAEGNYVYNCDVHECFDQYTKNSDGSSNAGDNADGIDCADITERSGNERVNTIRGVRSWNNSDDGFDHYRAEGILIIDSCWVWHNGYNYGGTTPTGNGNGFKLGKTYGTPESVVQRKLTNCIAYGNRQRGYSQEDANVNMIFYNNIAYKNNLQGFSFVTYNRPDILRNNIAYKNSANGAFQPNQTHDHNSWDSGVTVSDADFQSLDATQLVKPRKANGCLPDITFLALAAGSDMIDKGINVNHIYSGKAPDLGPFETGVTALASPVYVSSVIQSSALSRLEMTYNMSLASVIPAAASFTVMVNSVARTVSTVAISGTKVILTLSSPVSSGNKVTVSYTKPSINPLQSTASSQAASISAQPVTVGSLQDMLYVGSVVENATPSNLTITYNLPLSTTILPDVSRFAIYINSVSRTISSYSVSGAKVILKLANPIAKGDIVTAYYTKPSTNLLQSTAGNPAPNMAAKPVTNNVGITTLTYLSAGIEDSLKNAIIPEYLSSVVEDISPDVVEIAYTTDLSNAAPESSAFIAKINGDTKDIKDVTINGNKVILALRDNITKYDIVTVTYNTPLINPLQAISGVKAFAFADMPVQNNTNNEKISIFPNPASDFINISNLEPTAGSGLIRIFDLSGNLCLEKLLNSDSENRIPINLKSGMYVVQIVFGPIIKYAQKLIIK